jgi:hypothetical protein
MTIICRGCGATKEGNPHLGCDCITGGWKLVMAQDMDVCFISLCPVCRTKVETLAEEITTLLGGAKFVTLFYLRSDEKTGIKQK